MDLNENTSDIFGSESWYQVIKDTYNLNNPCIKENLKGLLTPISHIYSFLPFSDWYYEVEEQDGIQSCRNQLNTILNCKFQARILLKREMNSEVSTYRIESSSPDDRLRMMSNTTRRYTRRSLENSLHYMVGGLELLDIFYRLHSKTRKRQGLPVQPIAFFRNLLSQVRGSSIVVCHSKDGKEAASFIIIKSEDIIYYKYGASSSELLHLRPNHFLFFHLHDIALQDRILTIDLGRTDERGLHRFKKSLGARSYPIVRVDNNGIIAQEENKKIQSLRGVLKHMPVQVHIILGKLFYRFFA